MNFYSALCFLNLSNLRRLASTSERNACTIKSVCLWDLSANGINTDYLKSCALKATIRDTEFSAREVFCFVPTPLGDEELLKYKIRADDAV